MASLLSINNILNSFITKRGILLSLSFLFCINGFAQNLVPNPGFEFYTQCPSDYAQINKATGWFNCIASCDYFNVCSTSPRAGAPNNAFGQQNAYNGNAYGGFGTYVKKLFDAPSPYDPVLFWDGFRETVGIRLSSKLKSGMKYTCGFYTSRSDSSWYATKNLGMLFTADSLYLPQGSGWQAKEDLTYHLIYELDPQIRYSDTAYLSDRIGWMKIEGSFIANGTEEFLYIGNFDPNADVDTLMVYDSTYNQPAEPLAWSLAYYYIDDVWVYEDSTTSVEETPAYSISIYPNPATEVLNIKYNQPIKDVTFINIYDATGKFLFSKTINDLMNIIDISNYNSGFYMYRIVENNQIRYNGKFTIVR